jgi:hypothetical protein
MLVQASAPRLVFDMNDHPKHVRIHTLRKLGVSDGSVLFSYVADLVAGVPTAVTLEPHVVYPIEGEDGFEMAEFFLPFEPLFKVDPSVKRLAQSKYEAEAVAPIGLASIVASGFTVTLRSAYRSEHTTYAERVVGFKLIFPMTGGGIIRLADSPFDLANPTFSPGAALPRAVRDPVTLNAFNRTHAMLPQGQRGAIEQRRKARIAEAEASERANKLTAGEREGSAGALPDPSSRMLPSGNRSPQ